MRHSFADEKVAAETEFMLKDVGRNILKLGFFINKMNFDPDMWKKEVLGTALQVKSKAFQV